MNDKIDGDEEVYPQTMLFNFRCPECTSAIVAMLVNDGEKIMQQPADCDCGWSKEAIEVTDIEVLDDKEN